MGRSSPLMMSVGLAAVVTCLIRKRELLTLGWGWGSWRHQWQSYLLPLAIITITYLIIWLTDLGGWYDTQFVLELKENYNLVTWADSSIIIFHFLLTGSISFMLVLPAVLGEEIAWRGLLVTELSKFLSFTAVALVSGFLWSLWHWPMIIAGIYGNNETPLFYQLFVFTLSLMSASMIMTYLRFKTNSLWTAVVFHMSWNAFMQKAFTPITLENENSVWFLDEFGIVLAVVTFVFAIYFWKKGRSEFG